MCVCVLTNHFFRSSGSFKRYQVAQVAQFLTLMFFFQKKKQVRVGKDILFVDFYTRQWSTHALKGFFLLAGAICG